MSADRYVVLGLAHVRSSWFSEVARWSTAGSLPLEFVKCVSVQELRTRVASGRVFSAVLLDGRLPGIDRDLLATMADARISTLVVADSRDPHDWAGLGATATLEPTIDRAGLLAALGEHSRMVGGVEAPVSQTGVTTAPEQWRGRLIAVIGPPGSGRSTVAAALAQGLADDPRNRGEVLLVDLARRAHQAILHDARDVVPGIQEVVEAHRMGHISTEDLRQLTFSVPDRGYRLVLGLRRPNDWITIRSRAFGTALDAIQRSARVVVADCDPELDGEAETGSFDIEDSHLMTRATIAQADVVVVVCTPTVTGLHGMVTVLADLRTHRIPVDRTVAVVNRAPRAGRSRAELTRALANLTSAAERPDHHIGPVFVSERRGVDLVHRDLHRFPSALVDPVTGVVVDTLQQVPTRLAPDESVEPVPIRPGSLGSWYPEEEAVD